MKPARKPSVTWSVTAAILLVVIGTAGAMQAAVSGASFMYHLEESRSALARSAPVVVEPGTPRLARHVVIVIVDGLRHDHSLNMPFLQGLAARGSAAVAQSHYPSWSRPNYVSILTGVPPLASGVRTNRHHTPVTLDSLMDRARHAGLKSASVDDNDALPRLFLRPPSPEVDIEQIDIDVMDDPRQVEAIRASDFDLVSPFDDARYAPWPGGFADAGRAVLADHHDLVVLLFGAVDIAGHSHGADRPEYAEAVQIADRALAKVLGDFDFERDAVIVVADHGHTGRGGHGGTEPEVLDVPLVMAGAGVRVGAAFQAPRLIDVPTTAAALLGIAAPGHGLGRTLVEALQLRPEDEAARKAADAQRMSANQRTVDMAGSSAASEVLARRALRLAFVVAGFILAVVMAVMLHRVGGARFDWRALLIAVPSFFFVYYMMIASVGQRFSPSLLPARGHISLELAKYGVAAMATQILMGWFALRRHRRLADRLAAANAIAWSGLVLTMIPAGLMWAFFPAPYVDVPAPRTLVLIPALQVAVAAYALGVALSLIFEVIVFSSRAVDPRVRLLRLERALERARVQVEQGTGKVPKQ